MPKVELNQISPEFSMQDLNGDLFSLRNLHGKKNVLLVFNRGFM